jgi:hypothetical protein
MSVIAGSILVAGYRSLLAFSPYLYKILGKRDLVCSILLAIVGLLICFVLHFYTIGALLIASGLSVGGFILKAIAAEDPSTSALNRLAITTGNIGAGAILFFTENYDIYSIGIVLLLLVSCCFLKMPASEKRTSIMPLNTKSLMQNKTPNLIWCLFGIAIGIRVFGMYVIMPQYLINTLGHLPEWYGLTLILYGIVVILTQIPVIHKKVSFPLSTSIIALAFSCIVMSVPNLFFIETFLGAMLWCFCLAIEELFAPFIDFHAACSNHLLIKEISIGIGGAICFLVASTDFAIIGLGALSTLCIIIGSMMYQKSIKLQSNLI